MNKTANFYFRTIPVCMAILFSACESMIRYIDVEPANLPPMLAVSSIIDTGGSFFVSFTEARSTGSYRNWRSEEETIIRKGEVTLYDETADETVTRISKDAFDMSLRQYESGYSTTIDGLRFEAGHTYRLTLDIDGYPLATSTAVMPDAPLIEQISIDMRQTLRFNNAYQIAPFEPNTFSVFSIACYPLALHLTDNSPNRDYYMTYTKIYDDDFDFIPYSNIAISDRAVIQDNPDIEAAQLLMDGEVEAFVFDRMLFSDMSFANTSRIINLLVQTDILKRGYDTYPEYSYDKSPDTSVSLCVAHLSSDAYAHYRSLTLQKAGMGFFSEPVSIVSNIENGYGCFSAINLIELKIEN